MFVKPDEELEYLTMEELDYWQEFTNILYNFNSCEELDLKLPDNDFHKCPLCFVERGNNGFIHNLKKQ